MPPGSSDRGWSGSVSLTATLRRSLLVAGLLIAAGTPQPTSAQSTLRIAAYNIRHGQGTDDRVDLSRIAEVLRALDADVITLQEVDNRTERTGGVDQVQRIAEQMGYQGFHGAHRAYQGGEYGNAILTRLPVTGVRTYRIPPASGSALTVHEVEVTLPREVTTSTGASTRTVSVVSVHLAGTPDERLAQADSVTRFFAGAEHPVFLAGDFNGWPDGPVVERLRHDWLVLGKSGNPNTYPSPAPDREIDFIMTHPRLGLDVLEHRVIEEAVASDHRPILAVVRLN